MRCFVYRCARRSETYLYLAERDAFERVPADLREPLGRLEFVVEFELSPGRRLAREDADVVRANLAACGFHLQLPPTASAANDAD